MKKTKSSKKIILNFTMSMTPPLLLTLYHFGGVFGTRRPSYSNYFHPIHRCFHNSHLPAQHPKYAYCAAACTANPLPFCYYIEHMFYSNNPPFHLNRRGFREFHPVGGYLKFVHPVALPALYHSQVRRRIS